MDRRTCLKTLGSLATLSAANLAACRGRASSAKSTFNAGSRQLPAWAIGPFTKRTAPVLEPDPSSTFYCPVSEREVQWEAQNVYNPAAVVHNDRVYLLYRGDDFVQHENWDRTCRTGLAFSEDGVTFERHPEPVLYPDNDRFKEHEWVGGTEDIHVIQSRDMFYANYTAWNGETDTMMLATSPDLYNWTKQGPALGEQIRNPAVRDRTGVIVSRLEDGQPTPVIINGVYWMYYGLASYIATSENLIDWTPMLDAEGQPVRAFETREGYFDSGSCEAGAVALLTDDGIVLMFNAYNRTAENGGAPDVRSGWSGLGQALMDGSDPSQILDRLHKPFLEADLEWELDQFIPVALVSNALVPFNGEWHLYYGGGDRYIGMARGPRV